MAEGRHAWHWSSNCEHTSDLQVGGGEEEERREKRRRKARGEKTVQESSWSWHEFSKSQWTTCSDKATPPNPNEWNQTDKYISLWGGHSPSNHHTPQNVLSLCIILCQAGLTDNLGTCGLWATGWTCPKECLKHCWLIYHCLKLILDHFCKDVGNRVLFG